MGLSALLVSTDRAISRASTREASDRLAPRFFVYVRFIYLNLFTVVAKWHFNVCMPMGKVCDYVVPLVEVVEVEVEKGFAASNEGYDDNGDGEW